MTELTNILHLTDLHLGKAVDFNHERIIDALCKDLTQQVALGTAFDFCLFSGDVSNTGDEEHFVCALGQLLRILESAGLDESRLIVCPGNHDADRRVVGPNLTALQSFRNSARKREGANALLNDPDFLKYTSSTFNCFKSLAEEFSRDAIVHRDVFCTVYFLRSASIVAINTALLTSTGLSEGLDDRGALAFPEATLVRAIKECPQGVPIIVMGHHPLEFFNDVHSSMLLRIFSEHAVAYFCGHLHDPVPKAVRSLNGNLFISQGGALYEQSQYWNGYVTISADLERGYFKGTFRRWWEPRREFSCAEDIADNGIFYSSEEAARHWTNLPAPLNKSALEAWRTTVLFPIILKEYNECLTSLRLEDVFVQPEFERDVIFRKETDEKIGSQIEAVTFEKLLNENYNCVISSPKETGKTTVLKQLALSLARREISDPKASIPVLVNFGSFRHHRTSIETLVKQRLPSLPPGSTALGLLEKGLVTLLIDEVDFRSIERRDGMLTFFATYPKCRYILTSSTTFVESAALQPEISPVVPFVRVRMRSMRPRQLLALIENHGTRDPLKADQLLERVTRDASALNVPLTAVTSTFFIQIFREQPDDTPINQAALVERYIEMLLQKFAPRELLPATFNFKNKVDLLSVIAEHMARLRKYDVEQNEFLGLILLYLREYGLKFKASDILRYLIESKVLECDGDNVRFRLRIFFEFFLATRMREDSVFREFVFSEENYLSYPNEISFYSAITLRDKQRIDEIYQRFLTIGARVSQNAADGSPLVRYLETVEEPDPTATEDDLLAMQEQIRSPMQAVEDRRALLEGEGAEVVEANSQEVIRPKFVADEDIWLAQLVLLSTMLKHMELISDQDKRRMLSGVLDGWLRFTANSLGIVGTLAKERRVVFNGVTYISLLGEDLTVGEVARRITLTMPIAVAKLASLFLGTEKLQLQLEEGLGTEAEPVSRQFFRFAILSDLMVDNLAESAEKVEKSIRGYRYLTHVFSRKLYEVAVRYRLPDKQLARIRSMVGDLITNLSGVTPKESNNKKVRILRGLERQRLIAYVRKSDPR